MRNKTVFNLIKNLLSVLSKKRKIQIILLILFSILVSFAEVFSIGALLPFLSVIINPEILLTNKWFNSLNHYLKISNNESLLFTLTIIFSSSVLLAGSLRLLLMNWQIRLSGLVSKDLSIMTYSSLLNQDYLFHINSNTSELIALINKSGNIGVQILNPLLVLFSSTFIILGILISIVIINPFVSLISFICFSSIYFLIILLTKKKISKSSKSISLEEIEIIKNTQEGLGGIRNVIIDSIQNIYITKFQNSIHRYRNALIKVSFVKESPRLFIETLSVIFISIAAYFFSLNAENGQTILPTLGLIVFASQRLLPSLQQAYSAFITIRSSRESVLNVLENIFLIEPPKKSIVIYTDFTPFHFNYSILLENISFKFNEKSNYIFKNVNLIIEKGDIIGFIGKSGAGKSTLLDIIMMLLYPTSGSIKIDNIIADVSNSKYLQSFISHVPQSIFLTDSTIIENIAFGTPYDLIDKFYAVECAKKAKIHDFIETLKFKYDTNVGERGTRLSGGQRQRIAMARALYKKAALIILDEATSALDDRTEEDVMNSFFDLKKDVTIIIAAHRVSTLKQCNKVYEVTENGLINKK